MQVSIQETGALARRMTVGIPRERIQEQVQARLKELAQTTKINGFRPGKVPLRVVEQRFGNQVKQEVVGEIVQKSFYEAIEQEKLQLAGDPHIDLSSDVNKLDEGFSYVADFEIFPDFSAVITDGIAIEKPIVNIQDEDVEDVITRLRLQRRVWEETPNLATEGCKVTFDSVFILDGNPVEELTYSDQQIVLGDVPPVGAKAAMLELGKKIEAALYNSQVGDVRRTAYSMQAASHIPESIAGKEGELEFTVKRIENGIMPEVDTTFAQSLGVESGLVEDLYRDVRDNMQRELDHVLRNITKQELLNGLLGINNIQVPANLVNAEAQRMADNIANEAKLTEALTAAQMGELMPEAERRVKLGLLMSELVRRSAMQPDVERVRMMLEQIASAYEDPNVVVDWYYDNPNRLQEIENMVLEEQVVDMLLQQAQITEIPKSFAEVIGTK